MSSYQKTLVCFGAHACSAGIQLMQLIFFLSLSLNQPLSPVFNALALCLNSYWIWRLGARLWGQQSFGTDERTVQ